MSKTRASLKLWSMKIPSVLKEHSKWECVASATQNPSLRLHTPFWPCFFRNMSNCHTKDFYINFASRDWGWREAGFRRCKKMRRTKIFESLPNYYHNMDLSRTPRTISMMMICPCNLIMVQREFSNSKDYKLRTLNLKEFSFQTWHNLVESAPSTLWPNSL